MTGRAAWLLVNVLLQACQVLGLAGIAAWMLRRSGAVAALLAMATALAFGMVVLVLGAQGFSWMPSGGAWLLRAVGEAAMLACLVAAVLYGRAAP